MSILAHAKEYKPSLITKTSIMLGQYPVKPEVKLLCCEALYESITFTGYDFNAFHRCYDYVCVVVDTSCHVIYAYDMTCCNIHDDMISHSDTYDDTI